MTSARWSWKSRCVHPWRADELGRRRPKCIKSRRVLCEFKGSVPVSVSIKKPEEDLYIMHRFGTVVSKVRIGIGSLCFHCHPLSMNINTVSCQWKTTRNGAEENTRNGAEENTRKCKSTHVSSS
jgi:hypothetical protein